MPQDLFGISFMPGAEGQDGQNRVEPFQEAVKLLNLRLPSVIGARSPIGPQLLGATGLQGQPDTEFLRNLLGLRRRQPDVMGPQSPQMVDAGMTDFVKAGTAMPSKNPPPPRFLPGQKPGAPGPSGPSSQPDPGLPQYYQGPQDPPMI